jgi:hypothetical protein
MAWMIVVGNEGGEQNRTLPAAVGVVCASDLNDAQTRVLSPDEQQQINNVIQQFTQVTNIDQVINIINNVTTPPAPPQNETGGMTPPPADDTGGGETEPPITEEPLRVEIIPSATEVVVPTNIQFDANITGGTEPYTYRWGHGTDMLFVARPWFIVGILEASTFDVILSVTDSKGQTASDSIQITARERQIPPGGVEGEEQRQQQQTTPTIPPAPNPPFE